MDAENGTTPPPGEVAFLLFGMGSRRKLLYAPPGRLLDAVTLEPIRQWEAAAEQIDPAAYAVTLSTPAGAQVRIVEDEEAVWVEEEGTREPLTQGRAVRLPRFEGHPQADMLRVLHAELLTNLTPFGPVPNLWVYPRPWYRDAAMVLMCLKRTGNLELVEPWVAGLRQVCDHNNRGVAEPDNLGQALYMISLFGEPHPLVEKVLAALPAYRHGDHLCGLTDGAAHSVYQTKWIKFGLRSLGLDDPFQIPAVPDPYSALFWWEFRESHVETPRFAGEAAERYPYLPWAEAHFYREPPPPLASGWRCPLTWESRAAESEVWRLQPLVKLGLLPPEHLTERRCAPHTWHAAEMFLYYLDYPQLG